MDVGVIQVEQAQEHQPALGVGLGHRAPERFLEQPPVRQAGQRIEVGELLEGQLG